MTFDAFRARAVDELFGFDRPSTSGEAIFARLFEGLILLWTLQHAWTWAAEIQRIEAVVLPLGLAQYLDVSVFFDHGWSYVLAAGVSVAMLLGFLRRFPYAYAAALLGFHLLYVSRYSLGEISHGSNFVGMGVLAFAIGTAVFRDSEVATRRFAFGLLYFMFGVGYVSAGMCKLIGTGIDWPAATHFALWVGERTIDVTSREGSFEPTIIQSIGLAYPWFATATLGFGLVVELAGVGLWFRRSRPWVLLALIMMHIGIDLTLDILFFYNIAILSLLALPIPAAIDAVLRARRRGSVGTPPVGHARLG